MDLDSIPLDVLLLCWLKPLDYFRFESKFQSSILFYCICPHIYMSLLIHAPLSSFILIPMSSFVLMAISSYQLFSYTNILICPHTNAFIRPHINTFIVLIPISCPHTNIFLFIYRRVLGLRTWINILKVMDFQLD